MEAALALEMTDSEFIEIIKLALEHETNFRTVFCMVGKISVAAILTAVRFVEFWKEFLLVQAFLIVFQYLLDIQQDIYIEHSM